MIEFKGLQNEEFIHPQDKAAWADISKAPWFMSFLKWVMTKEAQFEIRTDLLSNAVEVTPSMMPELHRMTQEVCAVLDYEPLPRVFTCRSSFLGGFVYAGDNPILVLPDFLLNNFDEEMLRFQIGRLVTALKTNNAMIRTAVIWLLSWSNGLHGISRVAKPVFDMIGLAARLILADWVRKTGYTADRGALLACQDESVAMKALFRYAGLPVKYIDPSLFPEYIAEYQKAKGLASFVQSAATMFRTEAWPNDRIVELYKWYSSGEYYDLLEEYK